jgi:murein DD-endopeptidase MepM/ murein hydrolase activator NlpD
VGKILDHIKKAVSEKKKLVVKFSKYQRELVSEKIELDGIKYDKIVIQNSINREIDLTFDPNSYNDFSQNFLMSDGKTETRRGFLFKTETKGLLPVDNNEIIYITLYQEKDFNKRRESLREYLFGNGFYGDVVDNPEIAPTGIGRERKTGTFGCVRTEFKKSKYTKKCNDEKIGNLYKRFHAGIDIRADVGTELKSITSGTAYVHDIDDGDIGKFVQITSTMPDGRTISYVYGHMESINISNGSTVNKGGVIGTSGATGNAKNVDYKHCHITVKIDGTLVDPNGRMKTKFDLDGNVIN